MSYTMGKNKKITLFGQSHSEYIGVVIDNLPCGFKIDYEKLDLFLDRRKPGKNKYSTKRSEEDKPIFVSGLNSNGLTCGSAMCVQIKNKDQHSKDYDKLKMLPRPGHADFTAYAKYGDNYDNRGGGQFSGRMTAPICIAGGIFKQILENRNIYICAKVKQIGNIQDDKTDFLNLTHTDFEKLYTKAIPVFNSKKEKEMENLIISASENLDSVGGVIECVIYGLPIGIGEPIFDSIESKISSAVFSIPAVKAIEFGDGFGATSIFGSENNDIYTVKNGKVCTETNHCGGILGGISNGMPITFNVGIKPTPSISKKQQTVNLNTNKTEELIINGRHDPCIVQRAVPCIEAITACVIADMLED